MKNGIETRKLILTLYDFLLYCEKNFLYASYSICSFYRLFWHPHIVTCFSLFPSPPVYFDHRLALRLTNTIENIKMSLFEITCRKYGTVLYHPTLWRCYGNNSFKEKGFWKDKISILSFLLCDNFFLFLDLHLCYSVSCKAGI